MITHESILSRLAELRATAEAARDCSPPNWYAKGVVVRGRDHRDWPIANAGLTGEVAEISTHIATWDPTRSLRWIEWAERVANEHRPGAVSCVGPCGPPWPCPTYAGLAGALGLEET